MSLTLRRAAVPLFVLAGVAVGLHLYEDAGVQATLNYNLPASARPLQRPAALHLRVLAPNHPDPLATLFARVSAGQERVQQALLLQPGELEVRGALKRDDQTLPLRATVQIHRAGTYEVYLEPSKE